MLTNDEQTALLMVIADQRIQIANLTNENAVLKRTLVGTGAAPEADQATDG